MPADKPLDRHQVKEAQELNQRSLKGAPNGGTLEYVAAPIAVDGKQQLVVLIGHRHKQDIERPVTAQAGKFKGTIDVGKGGFLAPGDLTVTKVPGAQAAAFKKVIAEFSKKKIIFK